MNVLMELLPPLKAAVGALIGVSPHDGTGLQASASIADVHMHQLDALRPRAHVLPRMTPQVPGSLPEGHGKQCTSGMGLALPAAIEVNEACANNGPTMRIAGCKQSVNPSGTLSLVCIVTRQHGALAAPDGHPTTPSQAAPQAEGLGSLRCMPYVTSSARKARNVHVHGLATSYNTHGSCTHAHTGELSTTCDD